MKTQNCVLKPILTATYSNLGFVYKKKGEYRKAEEYYQKSIEIRSRNRKRNPSAYDPPLALVYTNYATLLNVIGKNQKAQEICERAYTIRYALAQEEPAYKVSLAYTLHEYGVILTAAGEHMYPMAEKYFEEALEIREKLVGKDEKTYDLDLAETKLYYTKAIDGWRELTKRCRQVFEPKLKKAEEDHSRLQEKNVEIL